MRSLPFIMIFIALVGLDSALLVFEGVTTATLLFQGFFGLGFIGLYIQCKRSRAGLPITPCAPEIENVQIEQKIEENVSQQIQENALVIQEKEEKNIEVYSKSLPALFKSIITYLNNTSEPMTENLVKIKTDIQSFVSSIHNSRSNFENFEYSAQMQQGITKLRSHITEITTETSHSNERFTIEIQRLDEQMKTIAEILGNISDIAERVHVLSINASIEAARAGTHGRGFKIIADEIQKLAKETQSFVGRISHSVGATEQVFDSLQTVMKSNQTIINKQIIEDSSTYDGISHMLEKQIREVLEVYNQTIRFIESLETDMTTLSPLAMLHAIIIQEIENLDLVVQDLLANFQNTNTPVEDVKILRKRLTTSRELDALAFALRSLGLENVVDLQRNNTSMEFF